MIQSRRNVFETNSSYSHSISISNDIETDNNLEVEGDKVYCRAGEFGWEIEDYTDAQTKLNYLITMAAATTVGTIWTGGGVDEILIEEFIETDDFKEIQECVCKVTKCKELVVESLDGYIDHQSMYNSMREFLADNDLTIEQFIFGDVLLHTDNDNH